VLNNFCSAPFLFQYHLLSGGIASSIEISEQPFPALQAEVWTIKLIVSMERLGPTCRAHPELPELPFRQLSGERVSEFSCLKNFILSF
jgi:hypothetical protein